MPHELLQYTDGQTGFIERTNRVAGPAWHKLGTVFAADEPLTVTAGARQTRADQITVVKAPLVAATTDPRTGKRYMLSDFGMYSLVRMPMEGDERTVVFGKPVTESFTLVSMGDVALMLDEMKLTDRWPLETMGVIFDGARVFISFKADTIALKGHGRKQDEVGGYFLVVVSFDGMQSNTLAYTGVRVVCNNTLTAGLKAATATIRITHTTNVAENMKLATALMAGAERAQDKTTELWDALAAHPASDADARSIIEAAFPLKTAGATLLTAGALLDGMEFSGDAGAFAGPGELSKDTVKALLADKERREHAIEAHNKRMQGLRARADAIYQRECEDFPDLGRLWLGMQAAGEICDWYVPQGSTLEKVTIGATFDGMGVQAKARAMEAAQKLLTAGRR